MSDDDAVETGGAGRPDDVTERPEGGTGDGADGDGSSGLLEDAGVWRALRLGAIGLLAILALVATIQLYFNASAAVGQWVSSEYVSVFQAAFNLVVLLLALAGLAVLARRR